jgi:TonB family protein
MNTIRFERRTTQPEAGVQARSAWPSFAVSFGLHALIIGALFWAPLLNGSGPRLPPGAISVNLVSLPAPGPAPGAGEGGQTPEKPRPVEPPKPSVEKPAVSIAEPVPPPKVVEPPKAEVSLAPIVKEKKSLKEQTKDNQKMIERAIERIEKKVGEPEPSSVTAAIDRLRKKLGESEPGTGRPGPAAGIGPPAAGTGGVGPGGGGGGGGPGQIEPIDIYRVSIASQVEKNWAFSSQLAGSDKNLKVGLVFKVLPNGEITDIRYTQRSNNAYLDESAYKAIMKSNPVAGHPSMIRAPYVEVAIRFTPEGIK